ncbi:hypothetical protein PH362_21765 [Photorhabdus bodei]|uniref:Uncharacterized protein n=1 Tax=Photorhabdus bodei TaxID=2029681 RepID=A0AAW6BRZ1_9GAMM|nr:hypothetical protein [Photorhabdus bodei]MDB6374484.1 hypothetical protein [Photorhabdus bodei]
MEIKKPILVSIKFDTSELDKKIDELIDELKAAFLEDIPETVLNEISDLFSNVIFTNCSTTRGALGAVDVVYFLDINAGAYNEILATIRALKL